MTRPTHPIDRRTVLKGIVGAFALSAAGGGLAACGGSKSSTDTTGASAADTTAPASTAADTTAAATMDTAAATTTAATTAATGSLVFDPTAFTELTTTVTTAAGDKKVVYHFYKAVPYVTNPVAADYQSLVVSVPVSIDGKAVDASTAPILFANSVAGYLPSSVATAAAVGAAGMGGGPAGGDGGAPPQGAPPAGAPTGAPAGGPGGGMGQRQQLALAAGYVVVEPGCRGRTLTDSAGTYYGTAPAAIVDLKAAVRYVRANQGLLPGDTTKIVSAGTSAGGALSSLLAASAGSDRYDSLLQELGAADASDEILAAGAWCPITDLDHADMMYEWNWGSNALSSGSKVDQTVSKDLIAQFVAYEASLALSDGSTAITADNLGDHILTTYLQPAATKKLSALTDADRTTYLKASPFITWAEGAAAFTWADFLTHVGARKKDTPAFDAFDLSAGENNLFGTGTTKARHFTEYSLRHASGATASLDADIADKLALMNPMGFLRAGNETRAKHWWIRVGTNDSDASLSVVANLRCRPASSATRSTPRCSGTPPMAPTRTRRPSSPGSGSWPADVTRRRPSTSPAAPRWAAGSGWCDHVLGDRTAVNITWVRTTNPSRS